MYSNSVFSFSGIAYQSALLALESQQVIALRLTKIAFGGPDASAEAKLMVDEKIETMQQGGEMLMQGAFEGHNDFGIANVLKLYRSKVSANVKRLSY